METRELVGRIETVGIEWGSRGGIGRAAFRGSCQAVR